LRGTPDQLAIVARRFRIAYAVPLPGEDDDSVPHSTALYAFDRTGTARLLIPSLATPAADTDGVVDGLRRLIGERAPRGVWSRVLAAL
jgi:protein SCO1/2